MAQQTRTTNKAAFEQGDTPQGSNYVDLIDSFLSLSDTTAQTVTSDLSLAVVTMTEASANRGNFGTVNVSGTSTFTREVICSATAQFSGPVVVSGSVHFVSGPLVVSATSIFRGPMRSGGAAGAGAGYVLLVQNVTIISSHSAGAPATFAVPSGSDISAIYLSMEAPFTSGSLVTAQRIGTYIGGTGVSAASLISEIGVSASGQYNLFRTPTVAGNHNLIRNVTATVNVFTSTKALASAATAGQGMLTIHYIQRT